MITRRWLALLAGAALFAAAPAPPLVVNAQHATAAAAPPGAPPIHARSSRRLLLRNAMVIYGSARPPFGPVDVLVEDGVISSIGTTTRGATSADAVIDATGKYVMPGIVNTHMHWHEERQPGMAQPIQYERNLYL